jgi:transketolase C-terminal domain/subunit
VVFGRAEGEIATAGCLRETLHQRVKMPGIGGRQRGLMAAAAGLAAAGASPIMSVATVKATVRKRFFFR